MANKPTTLSFGNFKIWVEDGNSPGSFVAPCGFVQKSLDIEASVSEATVPDCDDPEAPAWTDRAVTALSATVAGDGVMAMESLSIWRDWAMSGASKNVRVEFDAGVLAGGGYYAGRAILQKLGQSVQLGSEGNKAQLSVNAVSDGEWVWVAVDV